MRKTKKPVFHIYDSLSGHWVATVAGKPETEKRLKELSTQFPAYNFIMKEVKK